MKIIKQLAEQAGMVKILDEHASEYGNGMFENTPYPELEKFAQLIVQECSEVIDPLRAEIDALQAKIRALESQEPVAEIIECSVMGQQTVQEIDGRWKFLKIGDKLYSATGAVQKVQK